MLKFQITDLIGFPKVTITDKLAGEVVIPINDSRTASCTISLYNKACTEVKPLSRMLKAFYNDHLVFWGLILDPDWNGAEKGAVVINAHDQTYWWKRNFVRFGDEVVDTGYTITGDGLWKIVGAAVPTPAQIAAYGVPVPGILLGEDTSAAATTVFKAERGQNIYDLHQDVVTTQAGPDWNLRPIDHLNPGAVVSWSGGNYAELSYYSHRGVDRTAELVFHYGFGRNNLDDMSVQPQGSAVINNDVRVAQGGETGSDETGTRAIGNDTDSWGDYGIWSQWDSVDYADEEDADIREERMQDEADATVDAYAQPPKFFTLTLPAEKQVELPIVTTSEDTYRYIDSFTEGDRIRAVMKKGFAFHDVVGRISQVTLQDDEKGSTATLLECVPYISA